MKTLYLDCSMGAAGDMLSAALLELLPDPDAFVNELNGMGIPHTVYEKSAKQTCGITGTHMTVRVRGTDEYHHDHDHHDHDHHDHDHHDHDHCNHQEHHHGHAHSDLASVEAILNGLAVSDGVKAHTLAVYRLIAEAESHVHGRPADHIHFHEVGTLDAIADVTAVCLLMERLSPDEVVSSPVHVGCGTVRCAHGVLPVPAPATAYLLRGVPIYGGEVAGELCTPTGAALLKHFVTRFAPMPVMRVCAVGYGVGTKEFPRANCVRAMLGETDGQTEQIALELSANIDDMTAEQIGFAMERLFEAGAVEVYTVPVGMKKSRPGTLLRAICLSAEKGSVLRAFFRHTTTLGVREIETKRYILTRGIDTYDTDLGVVSVKRAEGYGVSREKIEYEDVARIAREKDLSLSEADRLLKERID